MDRHTSSIAAEYLVAAELCRRGLYAQVTLGNLKKTDLLAMPENGEVVRIEVKAKQKSSWPACRGVSGKRSAIVFVDFYKKELNEQPDFYVLTSKDWFGYIRKKKRTYEEDTGRVLKIEDGTPIYSEEISKVTKKPFKGTTVKLIDVKKYKDCWDKIMDLSKA